MAFCDLLFLLVFPALFDTKATRSEEVRGSQALSWWDRASIKSKHFHFSHSLCGVLRRKKSIKNINIKLLGFWSICFMEKVFPTELGSWEVDKDALLLKLCNRQRISCWVVNKRSQALHEAEELLAEEENVDGSKWTVKPSSIQEGNPSALLSVLI